MKTGITLVLLYVLIAVGALAGWVMNLIDVISGFIHNVPMTTLFIGRIIGVVVGPLGAVLGYF